MTTIQPIEPTRKLSEPNGKPVKWSARCESLHSSCEVVAQTWSVAVAEACKVLGCAKEHVVVTQEPVPVDETVPQKREPMPNGKVKPGEHVKLQKPAHKVEGLRMVKR